MEKFLGEFNANLASSIVDYRLDAASDVMGFGSRPASTYREFFEDVLKQGVPGLEGRN